MICSEQSPLFRYQYELRLAKLFRKKVSNITCVSYLLGNRWLNENCVNIDYTIIRWVMYGITLIERYPRYWQFMNDIILVYTV